MQISPINEERLFAVPPSPISIKLYMHNVDSQRMIKSRENSISQKKKKLVIFFFFLLALTTALHHPMIKGIFEIVFRCQMISIAYSFIHEGMLL